jgi:hypothetical protein
VRYLFGLLCVWALGVLPVVGCSETAGTGDMGERQWGTPERIEGNDERGANAPPQVAMDLRGNAIAVWPYGDGTIWSNRLTPSDGWGTEERIDNNTDVGVGGAQVGVDPRGHAVAVWFQIDITASSIWSNRFTPSGGWGTEERIDQGRPGEPQVAVDAQGDAVAVWTYYEGPNSTIWSNRFTPSSGWGTAERIDNNTEGHAHGAQVAVDAQGDAVAVWSHQDPTYYSTIWSNRFTPSGGWGTAGRIDNNTEGQADGAQVAMDPSGNAVVVWAQWPVESAFQPPEHWKLRNFSPSLWLPKKGWRY